jgi:hypothetical protein
MALKKAKNIILTGLVIPTDWNDEQEVTAAALATADEKEYRIGGNKKGKELLSHLQRQAEVTGTLEKDERGRPVIRVKSYLVK